MIRVRDFKISERRNKNAFQEEKQKCISKRRNRNASIEEEKKCIY